MKRHFGLFIGIVVLSLLLISPLAAQEDGPARVGLRPDAPTYALHGPYWVGTMEFEVETDSHPTKARIWYPTQNSAGLEEVIAYDTGIGAPVLGHAIQDATPDVEHGPYPLMIFAHGMNNIRLMFPYLNEHIASMGFVVMAMDYVDSWSSPNEPLSRMLFTRPTDISWQIDYAEILTANGEDLEGMIDTERIAVVGHSLGGYTALAAAGAPLDLQWFSSVAEEHPEYCVLPPESGSVDACASILSSAQELAEIAGLETVPTGLWPSWGDPRIDTIVALAPLAAVFGPESLSGVNVPTMLMGASADRSNSPETNVYPVYEYLGSGQKSLILFEGADHNLFQTGCDSIPWAADAGFFWLCSDAVWDMNRAHDLINHFTTAFLLSVLYGDAEATAALSPDAVSFTGITYEATGF